MTIRLLTAWNGYPANALVTLDAGTETGLVTAKLADTVLTGGLAYTAPVDKTDYDQPAKLRIDPLTGAVTGLVGPGGARVYATDVSAPVGITNLAGLNRWRAALDNSIYVPAVIHCFGDSITAGLGYDGSGTGQDTTTAGDTYSYPGQLRTLFSKQHSVAEGGFISSSDQRCDIGATTAPGSTSVYANGGTKALKTTGTLTFTLPSCTGFDILFYEHDGSAYAGGLGTGPTAGGFTYAVDGAGATTRTVASPWDTFKTISVTGLAATTHSVVITGTHATNQAYIVGIRYHSGAGVCVARFGRGGFTTADVIGAGANNTQATAGQHRLVNSFGGGSPHLVVLALGHNDCTQQATVGQMTTVAQYKINLQRIIDVAVAAGACVLLMSEPDPLNPSSPVVGGSGYRDYWTAAKELAGGSNTHVAHIQIYDRWGDHAASAALGYMQAGDNVHPLKKGYGSMARVLQNVLKS